MSCDLHRKITIASIEDLDKAVCSGPPRLPECWPTYAVCADGKLLCWQCLGLNYDTVAKAVRGDPDPDTAEWRVVAFEALREDDHCVHCGCPLESIPEKQPIPKASEARSGQAMTPERARWLLDNTKLGAFLRAFRSTCDMPGCPIDPQGITRKEDAFIKERWFSMAGGACYHYAVQAIADDGDYQERSDNGSQVRERSQVCERIPR